MQDASQTNDNGSRDCDQARDRVIWLRTQAFAALLIVIVVWTMSVWYCRSDVPDEDYQIPTDLIVDLNQATRAELNLLPGVGEKLASDILKYRDEIGGFSSVEQLTNIRGIKEGRLLSLRKHLTVRSKAIGDVQAAP